MKKTIISFVLVSFVIPAFANIPESEYRLSCLSHLEFYSEEAAKLQKSETTPSAIPPGLIISPGPKGKEGEVLGQYHSLFLQDKNLNIDLGAQWSEVPGDFGGIHTRIHAMEKRGTLSATGFGAVKKESPVGSRAGVSLDGFRIEPVSPLSANYKTPEGKIVKVKIDYLRGISLRCEVEGK